MGKITRSLVITSLFPKTLVSWDDLEGTVRFLEDSNFDVGQGCFQQGCFQQGCFQQLEFFHPPGRDKDIKRLFQSANFSSILIAVPSLKGSNLSLCSLDEKERSLAVDIVKNCLERAAEIGSHSVMINSGSIYSDMPKRAEPARGEILSSCDAYYNSIEEIAEFRDKRGYPVALLLEPGDSRVHYFQLLGPTELVAETCTKINIPLYALTMDVAHIRENFEDVMASLKQTLPWCSHIHLCNCVMDDPLDPFYGDKHVDFDHPGACWAYDDFGKMFGEIKSLYTERDFTISLEINCRAEDNKAWFKDVIAKCPWFFRE